MRRPLDVRPSRVWVKLYIVPLIKAEWSPGITYVIRFREVGTEEWSYGFETPLTGCGVVGLKPNTEYEFEIRGKNKAGEGAPTYIKSRTLPDGSVKSSSPE